MKQFTYLDDWQEKMHEIMSAYPATLSDDQYADVLQKIASYVHHETKHVECIVSFKDSIGRTQYHRQCAVCGKKLSSFISHKALTDEQKSGAQPRTENDWKYQSDIRSRMMDIAYAANRITRHLDYNAYLLSGAWKRKRAEVLERESGICQGCGKNRAYTAHHLTYKHIGNELLFELVAICKECHDLVHQDKKRG